MNKKTKSLSKAFTISPAAGKSGSSSASKKTWAQAQAHTPSNSNSYLISNSNSNHNHLQDAREFMNAPETTLGFRLTLPEARDIMTGKDSIPKPGSTSTSRSTTPLRAPSGTVTSASPVMNMTPRPDPFGALSSPVTGYPQTKAQAEKKKKDDLFVIRTSEREPYQHQVTISSASNLLFHAKLCHLMESYCELIANHNYKSSSDLFDFSTTLVGLSNDELVRMHIQLSHDGSNGIGIRRGVSDPFAHHPYSPQLTDQHQITGSTGGSTTTGGGGVYAPTSSSSSNTHNNNSNSININISSPTKKKKASVNRVTVAHTSAVRNQPSPAFLVSLLNCAQDIVVEGRFVHGNHKTTASTSSTFDLSGVEVTVFSSQKHRQFVVCYRGTPEQQAKPASLKPEAQKNVGKTDRQTDIRLIDFLSDELDRCSLYDRMHF
jgi:hypothetical protein